MDYKHSLKEIIEMCLEEDDSQFSPAALDFINR